MKINPIKFFRTNNNNNGSPKPKPIVCKRFEYIKKGTKLDKFI